MALCAIEHCVVSHTLPCKCYNNNFGDLFFRPGLPANIVKLNTTLHFHNVTCHMSLQFYHERWMETKQSFYSCLFRVMKQITFWFNLLNIPSSYRRTTTGFRNMVQRNSHFPAWSTPTSNCFSLVTHRSVLSTKIAPILSGTRSLGDKLLVELITKHFHSLLF